MKVEKVIWFTTGNNETIGVLLGIDDVTKKPKAYIGIGEGFDEGLDTQLIKDFGAKFHPSVALEITEHFNLESR